MDFSTWETAGSGEKRSKLSVICDRFQFLGGKKGEPQKEAHTDSPVDYGDIPF